MGFAVAILASLCNCAAMKKPTGLLSGGSTKAALLASTSISSTLSGGSLPTAPAPWTLTHSASPSPLDTILSDMNRALAARLYYPGLLVALTIPEVCIALTFDDDAFVKQDHYAAF